MSDSNKQIYTKGATMIEKMGYAGIGPIGASGEGIWNPIVVPISPKCWRKLVIRFSDKIEDDSSRKGKNIIFLVLKVILIQISKKFKSSNLVDVNPTGTGTGTSEVEPCAKKQKTMTITNTMKEISTVTPPMCAPVASGQNPENSPTTQGFGMSHDHRQVVGNPQNIFVV